MYYSQSVRGFFSPDIHGENIPDDAVKITNERHTELMKGQSEGRAIVSGEDGYPVLEDPVEPEEQIYEDPESDPDDSGASENEGSHE